jgi:hypothetical protein
VNGGIYRWNAILAVKQVILSPFSVVTSATTVYVPLMFCQYIVHNPLSGLRDRCTYRRNLPRDIDVLGDFPLTLLDRAVEIGLAHCVATIGVLVDEGNQTVLDLQVHLETLFERLLQVSGSLYGKLLAAT